MPSAKGAKYAEHPKARNVPSTKGAKYAERGWSYPQSRPRQWADRSDPFYNHITKQGPNPAHGSGRIVQILFYNRVTKQGP
jgi:hypothetical protein